MRKALYFIVLLTFCLSGIRTIAQANGYAPGTTGYIYEQCKTNLSQSESLKDAHNSYCGHFIEGYVVGLMIANAGTIPMPHEQDPCFADKQKAINHINGRFCKNLPSVTDEKLDARTAIEKANQITAGWIKHNKQELNKPVTQALPHLLSPGPYCTQIPFLENDGIALNESLQTASWRDVIGLTKHSTLEQKFKQCKSDIKRAKRKSLAFKATKCGAEIMGFMAGTKASAHIQSKRIKASNMCEKPVKRLYETFNTAHTMCLRDKTNPLTVARIFVENYALIAREKGIGGWSNLFDFGDLGGVGFETIYRGFLCRNERELAKKKP